MCGYLLTYPRTSIAVSKQSALSCIRRVGVAVPLRSSVLFAASLDIPYLLFLSSNRRDNVLLTLVLSSYTVRFRASCVCIVKGEMFIWLFLATQLVLCMSNRTIPRIYVVCMSNVCYFCSFCLKSEWIYKF